MMKKKSIYAVKSLGWLTALFLATLLVMGCTADAGAPGAQGLPGAQGDPGPPGTAGGIGAGAVSTVQGNFAGDTAPAPVDAAGTRVITPTAVVLVNETGTAAATQTVTPGNGQFSFTVPTGHIYMVVFREEGAAGRTLGILNVNNQTGRTAFYLPQGSPTVDLGSITIDSRRGKGWGATDPFLPDDTLALPDSDGDGIPDVADTSADEDGDGVPDVFDAFPMDPAEWKDTDGDGIGDNSDPDIDGDGAPNAQDAFPTNPAEWKDTDGDGIGDNSDPDIDGDGAPNAQDAFPFNPAEWADTDRDGVGNNADPDDDNDGVPDAQDPFPLVAGNMSPVVPPPDMDPLNQIAVVLPTNLFQFVKNQTAAIRLGKAFFWDMQAGSDGIQACATCHFSNGADGRLKNALNPGTKAGDTLFGNNSLGVPGFPQFGPNYTLDPVNDFPFHQRANPADVQSSPILRDTNDVVGSQGVRLSDFVGVVPGSAVDSVVSSTPDPVFAAGGANLRRVTGRNTPSVINAVFNFTQFWDGRANFIFNGENPFGPADPNAGIWFDEGGTLVKRRVEIQKASLASQAVGPPLDDTEMSGRGRTFPDIGRKMLSLTPLGKQLVHPGDSVLGSLSKATLQPDGSIVDVKGLDTSYQQMIRDAFQDDLWKSAQLTPDGFTQMEANFSLFWGLAIQLYESTLVSDQTPFDRWVGGEGTALTDQQKLGFALFNGIANCAVCHSGTELTNASHTVAAFNTNLANGLIEEMFVADGTQVIYDDGFNNTAVTPTADDLGRGGTAPFINPLTGAPFPLAFSTLSLLQRQNLLPFESPLLDSFFPTNIRDNKDGLFKVPGLRNVELTAPYFHNGSIMTLEEVIDVYVRGGNFPAENIHDLDPFVGAGLFLLQGKETMHDALVAFLKSLTDPRVANQSAPFDHPQLFIPEGNPEVLRGIPATNANGQAAQP